MNNKIEKRKIGKKPNKTKIQPLKKRLLAKIKGENKQITNIRMKPGHISTHSADFKKIRV